MSQLIGDVRAHCDKYIHSDEKADGLHTISFGRDERGE